MENVKSKKQQVTTQTKKITEKQQEEKPAKKEPVPNKIPQPILSLISK